VGVDNEILNPLSVQRKARLGALYGRRIGRLGALVSTRCGYVKRGRFALFATTRQDHKTQTD